MEKKDNTLPFVSVIMATFNEPETIISEAIDSILKQDYEKLELLIADDSTAESTRRVIDDAARRDRRVKVLRANHRMGFVPSLNAALHIAKGELIARMDGDDISMPKRISAQVTYAQAHPDIDVFGGSMYIINKDGNIISERTYPLTKGSIHRMFMYRSPFSHPTVMFRRQIIDHGFYYDPQYRRAEDIDFYIRLYKAGYQFGNLKEKILKYRVMGDLQTKRPKDQWVYNHKARSKFIPSKPLFSTVSYLVSMAYKYVPASAVSRYYKKENSKLRK